MSYKCKWNPKLPECKTTILKIFFLENVSNENRTDHCCRVPKLTGTKDVAWGKWFLLRRFRGRKSDEINH